MSEDEIIEKLRPIHIRIRKKSGSVSEHTKSAQEITNAWQDIVCEGKSESEIDSEVKVLEHNDERIDIVDFTNRIAYELKVSGKNPHHEFYKDLIKVLTYNCNSEQKIRKLVFISEMNGINSLEGRIDPTLERCCQKITK